MSDVAMRPVARTTSEVPRGTSSAGRRQRSAAIALDLERRERGGVHCVCDMATSDKMDASFTHTLHIAHRWSSTIG